MVIEGNIIIILHHFSMYVLSKKVKVYSILEKTELSKTYTIKNNMLIWISAESAVTKFNNFTHAYMFQIPGVYCSFTCYRCLMKKLWSMKNYLFFSFFLFSFYLCLLLVLIDLFMFFMFWFNSEKNFFSRWSAIMYAR